MKNKWLYYTAKTFYYLIIGIIGSWMASSLFTITLTSTKMQSILSILAIPAFWGCFIWGLMLTTIFIISNENRLQLKRLKQEQKIYNDNNDILFMASIWLANYRIKVIYMEIDKIKRGESDSMYIKNNMETKLQDERTQLVLTLMRTYSVNEANDIADRLVKINLL